MVYYLCIGIALHGLYGRNSVLRGLWFSCRTKIYYTTTVCEILRCHRHGQGSIQWARTEFGRAARPALGWKVELSNYRRSISKLSHIGGEAKILYESPTAIPQSNKCVHCIDSNDRIYIIWEIEVHTCIYSVNEKRTSDWFQRYLLDQFLSNNVEC